MHKKSKKAISKLLLFIMFLVMVIGNADINSVKLFASDTSNSRKIDVWDFGGVQTSDALYNNNISRSTLDSLTTVTSSGTVGWFTGTTKFGDLSIYPVASSDRLYYYQADGVTKGILSYGTWGNATKVYDDGYSSNGCYYANGSGGTTRRYLTIDNVVAGDKISVYGGLSGGGPEQLHFLYTGTDGNNQDNTAAFSSTSSRIDFVAKYSGSYKIYVSTIASGKPYFHRVVRTPGVKVSGAINLNGNNISATSLSFVNQTTGDTTNVTINADNTFDVVLGTGYSYTAVLNGVSTAYTISDESKVVTTSTSDISAGLNSVRLDVVVNNLAKISGSITGFTAGYDLSNLQIKLVPQQGSLSPEVGLSIDKSNMTFAADVKSGESYTAVTFGVNDYEIVNGGSVNITANTVQNIEVAKKAFYTATGKFINLSSTANIQSISFTNVDDGYTYTGTVADGGYNVSLRNGAYNVKAVCTENYETTTHVIVNGQNTTKDLKFNQVNGWNLVNVTSADITAGTYKGLILEKGTVGGFGVNGNALSAKPGSSIIIPVVAGQIVTVSGWYSGEIYFSEDQVNKLVIPSSSSASSPAKLSYKAVNTGTVTLNITGTATAYLTAIDRVLQLDRVSDLYVGDSSKANNFSTVKEALDVAAKMNPTKEEERITIYIAPGTYRAQLKISTPYITLVNSNPNQEVKITWYYGFGYDYYSSGPDGFYNEDLAFDQYIKNHVSNGKWGGSVYLTSGAKEFKAENIVFENSFNKYMTEEELADGVALSKNFPQSTSVNVVRTATTDVTSKVATERAAAMIIEADNVEFYNCSFIGSQDTIYTGGVGTNNSYFKNCFIEGNTDYIFGDGNVVFDNPILNFCGYSDQASGGYITAAKDLASTAGYGYLFRNSTVTATSKNKQTAGFFGRPWGPKAKVTFLNTKLESSSIIDPRGWADMSGATPENANFAEYNTTYNGVKVDTAARRATVLCDESSVANVNSYFGDWTPRYFSVLNTTAKISYNLTNVNTDGPANAAIGQAVSFKATPQDGYILPDTITIAAEGKNLVQDVDYTYDKAQGVITVNSVTGIIFVTITAEVAPVVSEDFTIKSTFNMNSLQAGGLLNVETVVTNNKSSKDSVLVIVALYDGKNHLVSSSNATKHIVVGQTDKLSTGFTLPADVTNHKVKVFVWEGSSLTDSSMIPLSDVVTLE